MPKGKKKNNATTIFLQNQSMSNCLSGANSFSQAVVGINKESRKSSWPLLNPEGNVGNSLLVTQDSGTSCFGDSNSSFCTHQYNFMGGAENKIRIDAPSVQQSMTVKDELNQSQFPSLIDSFSKIKMKEKTFEADQLNSIFSLNGSTSSVINITRYTKKQKPKRNDPVQIDLVSALEASLLKKFKNKRQLIRRPKRETNHGNILDSSKPIQKKKGKVRPNKKKKLTSLRKLMNAAKLDKESVNFCAHAPLSNPVSNPILKVESLEQLAKEKIHTNSFQQYCTNLVTKELNESVKAFLVQIRIFQDRMFLKSEVKARAKKRYVCGFHECKKLIKAGLVKVVIIASNIEKNVALHVVVNILVNECEKLGITVVFACKCQHLSGCLYKKNRVCVVGILNYEGAEELYNKMIYHLEVEKSNYQSLLKSIIESNFSADVKDKSVEEILVTTILEKLKCSDEGSLNKSLIQCDTNTTEF